MTRVEKQTHIAFQTFSADMKDRARRIHCNNTDIKEYPGLLQGQAKNLLVIN